MAFGSCVVVNDTLEKLETIRGAGFSYDGERGAENVRHVLQELLTKPSLIQAYRDLTQRRAQAYFTWEAVTDAYTRLFCQLCEAPFPRRLQ
jgi:glycosyltransferase involved in cell wall biosynthesis